MSKYIQHWDDFFATNLVLSKIARQKAADEVARMRRPHYGYRTGITVLDDKITLHPKEFVLIGGRTGTGKSALWMQWGNAVAAQMVARKSQGTIAIFTMEMSGSELMLREACAALRIPIHTIKNGTATPQEYDMVEYLLKTAVKDNIYIDESPSPTIEHIGEQLWSLSEEGPIQLVMIDMFDLISDREKGSDKAQKVSYGLKALAKHYNTTVLATIQMNRKIDDRQDKTPYLSDFMNGGEQAADRAVALVRHAEQSNRIDCHTLKNRHGMLGHDVLLFDASTLRFQGAQMHQFDLNPEE